MLCAIFTEHHMSVKGFTVAVLVLVSRWQTAPFLLPQRCSYKYWELCANALWSRSDVCFTFLGCLCSVLPCCVWLCSKGISKAAQLLSRYTHVTLIQYLCLCVDVCVCWATEGLRLTYITRTNMVELVPLENCDRTRWWNIKYHRRMNCRPF